MTVTFAAAKRAEGLAQDATAPPLGGRLSGGAPVVAVGRLVGGRVVGCCRLGSFQVQGSVTRASGRLI